MSKTGEGLARYAEAQLGKPYWWGTFGQVASAQLLAAKRAQYPSYYTAVDFPTQYGKRVHDCAGLIKGFLWSDTPDSAPIYGLTPDVAVRGLYDNCSRTGDLSTIPEVRGVCVFQENMGHVGVYIGSGWVIEAMGHAYGVVKTALHSRQWAYWGMPKWIDYGSGAVDPAAAAPGTDVGNKKRKKYHLTKYPIEMHLLRRGDYGPEVVMMQAALDAKGFECDADGEFGPNTERALKDFQENAGLDQDGEYGGDSMKALRDY